MVIKVRVYLPAAAVVAAAVTLSACSNGNSGMNRGGSSSNSSMSSSEASASFNDTDVTFAQGMIAHHQQAVTMSDTILGKVGIDGRVLELATQIKTAQQPEIIQLQGWLAQWGAGEADMSGMNHGMMSTDDINALNAATGLEVSKLFLQQMIVHHQGAITMAQTEIDKGANPNAKMLAQTIVTMQMDEISGMERILDTL